MFCRPLSFVLNIATVRLSVNNLLLTWVSSRKSILFALSCQIKFSYAKSAFLMSSVA